MIEFRARLNLLANESDGHTAHTWKIFYSYSKKRFVQKFKVSQVWRE